MENKLITITLLSGIIVGTASIVSGCGMGDNLEMKYENKIFRKSELEQYLQNKIEMENPGDDVDVNINVNPDSDTD